MLCQTKHADTHSIQLQYKSQYNYNFVNAELTWAVCETKHVQLPNFPEQDRGKAATDGRAKLFYNIFLQFFTREKKSKKSGGNLKKSRGNPNKSGARRRGDTGGRAGRRMGSYSDGFLQLFFGFSLSPTPPLKTLVISLLGGWGWQWRKYFSPTCPNPVFDSQWNGA